MFGDSIARYGDLSLMLEIQDLSVGFVRP